MVVMGSKVVVAKCQNLGVCDIKGIAQETFWMMGLFCLHWGVGSSMNLYMC